MKQVRIWCSVALGIFLALGAVIPAQADSDGDDYVRTLVQRAFEGKLTTQEKAYLISAHRDVAAQLPDLEEAETESKSSEKTISAPENSPSGAEVAPRTWCKVFSGSAANKSLLGSTIYVFNHSVNVCGDNSVITKHDKPRYWLENQEILIDSWEVVDDYVAGVGSTNSTSRIQLRVKHCVLKYGCYANYYPTGTVVASANGTARISTVSD